jgi:hypothetical protein
MNGKFQVGKNMKKELLFSVTKKDLKIDYFSGKGAGGQHRNRHKNCVRIFHNASGAMATGQSYRERKSNLKEAFHGLVKHTKFVIWHSMMVQLKITGKSIDELVEEQLSPENLKVEVRGDKGWIEFGK